MWKGKVFRKSYFAMSILDINMVTYPQVVVILLSLRGAWIVHVQWLCTLSLDIFRSSLQH